MKQHKKICELNIPSSQPKYRLKRVNVQLQNLCLYKCTSVTPERRAHISFPHLLPVDL